VQLLESSALRNLQQVSEARGLKFYVNPPQEVLPAFLGDFRPDAIALGPDGGMIIEVKRRKSSASDRQLAEIAKRISDQKGWEFRAIYLSLPDNDVLPIPRPTPQQIEASFREIDALAKGGHAPAALVTAWAALESLARLARAKSGMESLKSFAPRQAIQTLAEEGYLENEAADRLRELARLRNAVVHGDFSVEVPIERVEGFLKLLRAIASDVTSVT